VTDKNELSPTSLSDTDRAPNRITRHDMATVTIRVVGIYFIVLGLRVAPMLYSFLVPSQPLDAVAVGYLVLDGGLYLAVGILLLVFGKDWGRRILPNPGPAQPDPTSNDLLEMAFAVVGAVLAAKALVGITIIFIGGRGTWQIYGPPGWLPYLGPAVQLALGIALFLGARGLTRFWHKLRSTSYGKEDE
jgi:hypothetical protein